MITRRELIKNSAMATAGLSAGPAFGRPRTSPGEKIVLAFIGVNGRGSDLAGGFVNQPNVEVAYTCDVDDRAIAKCMSIVGKKQAKALQGLKDFRKALDDNSVDALVIAA